MEENHKNIIIFVLVIILVLLWSNFNNLKEESADTISEYEDALDDANYNIEQANSNIEEAKWYAWSDYEDMGYALDNLETVDTVSRY